MISHNIRSLLYYIFEIFVSFVFLFMVNIISQQFSFNIGGLAIKIIAIVVFLVSTFLLGSFLSIKTKRKYDLFALILNFIICLGAYIYCLSNGGFLIDGSMDMANVIPYIILSPILILFIILGLDFSLLVLVLYFVIRSLIISIYMALRRRHKRKQREKYMARQRDRRYHRKVIKKN